VDVITGGYSNLQAIYGGVEFLDENIPTFQLRKAKSITYKQGMPTSIKSSIKQGNGQVMPRT